MVVAQFATPPWSPSQASSIRVAGEQIDYSLQQIKAGQRTEFQLEQLASTVNWLELQLLSKGTQP